MTAATRHRTRRRILVDKDAAFVTGQLSAPGTKAGRLQRAALGVLLAEHREPTVREVGADLTQAALTEALVPSAGIGQDHPQAVGRPDDPIPGLAARIRHGDASTWSDS